MNLPQNGWKASGLKWTKSENKEYDRTLMEQFISRLNDKSMSDEILKELVTL